MTFSIAKYEVLVAVKIQVEFSGLWRHSVLWYNNVSENHAASIFRMKNTTWTFSVLFAVNKKIMKN
jgi:hypothetical protein